MNPSSLLAALSGGAAGGVAGGALGQLSDIASAPRKALWGAAGQMLGQPDLPTQGNQLVAQLTGMDPNDPATQALGIGAEVAGDPLTWASMGVGGGLGFLGAEKEAAMAADMASTQATIQGLEGTQQAAQDALYSHQGMLDANRATQQARFQDLGNYVSPADQQAGLGQTFGRYKPAAADMMEYWGLGQKSPTGLFNLGEQQLPEPFALHPSNGMMQAPEGMPPLSAGPSPEEMQLIRQQMAQMGPAAGDGYAYNDQALSQAGQQMAAQTAPPMPLVGGVPASQAYGDSTGALQQALARLQGMQPPAPPGMLQQAATMGGLGAAGGVLGANGLSQPKGQRYF